MADPVAGELRRLSGQVRPYAWGGRGYIAELVGLGAVDGPIAEYWLGAHPDAPATVEGGLGLDRVVAAEPVPWLGAAAGWPYLLKVLDVAEPLSIQVHPDVAQARAGFAREDRLGIPRDAPQRNFRDPNAKPELAVALTPFRLLFGFAPDELVAQRLARWPSLAELATELTRGGVFAAFEAALRADPETLVRWLTPVFEAVRTQTRPDQLTPEFWLARWVGDDLPASRVDRGALAILLMNILELAPGEGIYQGPGVPHAYLDGRLVELMANSDNVLRCGLTPKHVDPEAVLAHLDPDARTPTLVPPAPRGPGWEEYRCPVDDFLLSRVTLTAGESRVLELAGPVIAFVMDGQATVAGAARSLDLGRGQAAAAGVADARLTVRAASGARLFVASLP